MAYVSTAPKQRKRASCLFGAAPLSNVSTVPIRINVPQGLALYFVAGCTNSSNSAGGTRELSRILAELIVAPFRYQKGAGDNAGDTQTR